MRFMKKTAALLATAAMMLGFAVPASAAVSYDVSVSGKTISFNQGGKSVGSYTAASSAITLTTDSDKDFLVQFTNTKGTTSSITLGKQKDLTISGTLDSVTVKSALASDISLKLATGSKVGQLVVYGKNPISINGSVTALTQNAGTVTVEKGATVEKARLTNANATLKANGTVTGVEAISTATITGAGVGTKYALKNTSVLGVNDKLGVAKTSTGTVKTPAKTVTPAKTTTKTTTTTTKTTSGTKAVKLSISVLDIDDGDSLKSVIDDLQYAVTAKDASTGAEITGACTWINKDSTKPSTTAFYRFRFTPDDGSYKTVTDKIKVRVDGDNTIDKDKESTGSDRTIKFRKTMLKIDGNEETDPRTLGDIDSLLNSEQEAYSRSEDTDLDGEFTWKKSSSTKIEDGKSYSFVFDPDDDDYKETTGSIKIYYKG